MVGGGAGHHARAKAAPRDATRRCTELDAQALVQVGTGACRGKYAGQEQEAAGGYEGTTPEILTTRAASMPSEPLRAVVRSTVHARKGAMPVPIIRCSDNSVVPHAGTANPGSELQRVSMYGGTSLSRPCAHCPGPTLCALTARATPPTRCKGS